MQSLPVLLLEVHSAGKGDRERMLLQASCLVRLGNSLFKDGSSQFIIKAIYIDKDFRAIEYTFYQSGKGSTDHVPQVICGVPLNA